MATELMGRDQGLLAEMVPVQGNGGDTILGYLARPLGAGQYPGIVVIMEVYGLLEHIKEITRKVASHGYNAIAPNLHHREGPGIGLPGCFYLDLHSLGPVVLDADAGATHLRPSL